jgi:hypothetical protein
VCIAVIAPQLQSPRGIYLFVAFCIDIAVLCVMPSSAPVTARVIGLVLLAAAIANLLSPAAGPSNEDHVDRQWRAVKGLLFFGLPGGYLLIFGRLPLWSKLYRMFHGDVQSQHDAPMSKMNTKRAESGAISRRTE